MFVDDQVVNRSEFQLCLPCKICEIAQQMKRKQILTLPVASYYIFTTRLALVERSFENNRRKALACVASVIETTSISKSARFRSAARRAVFSAWRGINRRHRQREKVCKFRGIAWYRGKRFSRQRRQQNQFLQLDLGRYNERNCLLTIRMHVNETSGYTTFFIHDRSTWCLKELVA